MGARLQDAEDSSTRSCSAAGPRAPRRAGGRQRPGTCLRGQLSAARTEPTQLAMTVNTFQETNT